MEKDEKEKEKIDSHLIPHIKHQLIALNVRSITPQLLENRRENLWNSELVKEFLDLIIKHSP